ncbi:unnamed protein product [Coregonus sp. 'balchen']|nr:unnamed protein product [Coregonus sp. 'balchen']
MDTACVGDSLRECQEHLELAGRPQADRQAGSRQQPDRQTDRQAGRQAGRQAAGRQVGRRQTGRQAGRQADRQTGRPQAGRQTGRQMGAWWPTYVSSSHQMSLTSPNPTTTSSSSNGSLSAEQLSKTNLYIRGLHPGTTDQDLVKLCQP